MKDDDSAIPVPPNLQGLAIPYFTEAQWHAARRLMEDAHTWHDSYAEFVERVAQQELQLRRQGKATIRVYVDVQEFVAWCAANARKVDGQSRANFAAFKAAQADRGSAGS